MQGRSTVFSSGDAIRFGWERTLANLKPLLVLGVVSAFLAMVHTSVSGRDGSFVVSVVVQIVQAAVGLVFLRVLLQIYEGAPVDLRRFSDLTRGFARYFVASLVVGVMVACGTVFLVVPGVLLALTYGLAPVLVVDKNLELGEALRESRRLTEGVRGELFVFVLVLMGVNLLGALALGLGLLLTTPTTGLAGIYVLRRLEARTETSPQSTSGGAVPPLATG